MSCKESDIAYFISFCIEMYKNRKGMSADEVIGLFDKYSIIEYLAENFEVLHTQSHYWILEEIDETIQKRKGIGV